ncbi:MAG: CorA family divalent cation transporter, partial [Oscillospiraceae bacterium]
IISNNLNIVMKALTSITILMAIPDIVSGIYGMNVTGLPMAYAWFPLSIIGVAVVIATIILITKGMFK